MPNQPGSDSRKIIEGQEGKYSRPWVQVRTGHYLPDGEQPVVITAKRNRNCIGHFPSPRFGSGFLLKRDDIRIRVSSPFQFPSLYIFRRKAKIRTHPQRERRSDFSSLVRPMRFERTAFGVGVPIKRIKVIKISYFTSNFSIYMQLKFGYEKLVHLVSDR